MSNTFTMTMQDLAVRAYRRLGILPSGGSPTDDQMTQAISCYNAMALGMQADGPSLFRLTQVSWTIPAGVGYAGTPYVTPYIIMGLPDARWVVTPAPNLFERVMGIMPYLDYMQMPNKRQADNAPTQVCIDKQPTQTNLYFWPLPVNGGTFNATVVRQVDSVSLPTDALDFPTEWLESLGYVLADRLMDDEGVAAADTATAQRITQHAIAFQEKLLNFDRPVSLFLRPWGRVRAGRLNRGR